MKTYEEIMNSDDADDYELTNERIQFISAYIDEYMEHAETVADNYLEAKDLGRSSSKLEFDGSGIRIQYTKSYCGCCQPEVDYEYMPLKYLWDENLDAELKQICEQRKAKEQAERERAARKREAETKAHELKQLAKLKEKYDEKD